MKIFFASVLSIYFYVAAFSQESKYLEFSAGLKHYQARDEYQSPLTYKGLVFSRVIGYSKNSDTHQVRQNISWIEGDLKNQVANKNTLNYNGIQYNSARFSILDEQSPVSYFVGFAIKVNFASRAKTNRGQYDVATSLAIIGAASYKEEPTDRWSHEALLSLPIFAWAVRPRYTSPVYIKQKAKWKGPSHLFLTLPKFMGFDFQLNSRWEMDNGNAFRIGYESQFYQILPLHPVRVFNHGLVATALMKVN